MESFGVEVASADVSGIEDSLEVFSKDEVSSPSTDKERIRSFCETLSPALIFTVFTIPPNGEGTSIDALSLSIVSRGSSADTVSPDLTKTSITSTSSNSPISGIKTSLVLIIDYYLRKIMD